MFGANDAINELMIENAKLDMWRKAFEDRELKISR